jgi:hypothetical protein
MEPLTNGTLSLGVTPSTRRNLVTYQRSTPAAATSYEVVARDL